MAAQGINSSPTPGGAPPPPPPAQQRQRQRQEQARRALTSQMALEQAAQQLHGEQLGGGGGGGGGGAAAAGQGPRWDPRFGDAPEVVGGDGRAAAGLPGAPPVHAHRSPPRIAVRHTQRSAAAAVISNAMNGPPRNGRRARMPQPVRWQGDHARQQPPPPPQGEQAGVGAVAATAPSAVAAAAAQADLRYGPGLGVEAVSRWRVSEVAHWLRTECGMAEAVPPFVEQNVDGQVLVELYRQLCADASGA
jgi:hypothetical protein